MTRPVMTKDEPGKVRAGRFTLQLLSNRPAASGNEFTQGGYWVQTNVFPDPRAGYLEVFERVYAGSEREAVLLEETDEETAAGGEAS